MSTNLIYNPTCPLTYFFEDEDTKEIAIGVVYNDDGKSWTLTECQRHAEELKKSSLSHLTSLRITYSYAGPLINISSTQVELVYPVVQAFVDRGARVYMNDQTQVTFEKNDTVTHAKMMEYKLKQLLAVKKCGAELMRTALTTPFHRSAYWTSPDGKEYTPGIEFARWVREQFGLSDTTNSFIGEVLAAKSTARPGGERVAQLV